MSEQSFSLIPFPAGAIPGIAITGRISRENNILTLHYALTGQLEAIILPARSELPGRKDELWKHTCFEYFLASTGQPLYWEFNLSPSGDWNVYHMDAYRRVGFREETSIQQVPFEVQTAADAFTLEATIDLNPIVQETDSLEVGITAVIQTNDGQETYWALTHPAAQPDFHLRESFILPLAVQTHPLEQSSPGD